jgi:hypothetical protein
MVARPAAQDRLVILGCRGHQIVVVVARVGSAQVLLAVMVRTLGAASPPMVCSYRGDAVADVQELGMEGSSVEEPTGFR